MFSKLYITIKASDKFDDSIIDPISFILIDWGVDGNLIDWDIYPSRAKLEINTENDNYQTYSITYQGMQTIMELCYECEFVNFEFFYFFLHFLFTFIKFLYIIILALRVNNLLTK